MRHKIFGRKLDRNYDQRRALFKNLARGFFLHRGQLKTTLAKARAVRGLIEKMISKTSKGDLVSRRWLFKCFRDQSLVNKIVDQFGPQFKGRKGGFLRIVKLGKRKGDNSVKVRLELVEELAVEVEEKTKIVGKKKERDRVKKEKVTKK